MLVLEEVLVLLVASEVRAVAARDRGSDGGIASGVVTGSTTGTCCPGGGASALGRRGARTLTTHRA